MLVIGSDRAFIRSTWYLNSILPVYNFGTMLRWISNDLSDCQLCQWNWNFELSPTQAPILMVVRAQGVSIASE